MRATVAALFLLSSAVATAAATAPSTGTITVQLDNGTIRTYPADKYVVVKRGVKKKKKDVVVVVIEPPAPTPAPAPVKPVVVQAETKKNRVRIMGGLGPNGIAVDGGPQAYSVSPSQELVGGIGYSRVLTGPWSVDAQAITNKTFTLGVGFDF